MSSYNGNHFADYQPAIYCRDEGWAAFTQHPWAPCPHYGSDGTAINLHIGAGQYDHAAPGFEYCLDAPIRLPAGSFIANGHQPYMD